MRKERRGLRNMARASRGKLEHIDEEAFVGITGVICQHSLVDILLSTFALQKKRKAFTVGTTCFEISSQSI